ncbi:MAG: ATP-binding cassette domain-containing protein [Bacilli bacterium]|nr:ATP-binding cassette domain-containing protein [Bacilli bacterium]
MEIIKDTITFMYPDKLVFNDVDVTINKGEIYLLIGRNGTGKSTLLRLLGKIEPYKFKKHLIAEKDISYMPSDLSYYPYMRIIDLLKFYHDTHQNFSLEFAHTYLEEFQLKPNKMIKKLSLGEQKILNYLICLSKEAKLYLIDEPFPYVDLLNDEIFRKMIINKYDEEKTFIIATHQINEFEKLASYCLLIKSPETIECIPTDEIRNSVSLSVEDYFKEVMRDVKGY